MSRCLRAVLLYVSILKTNGFSIVRLVSTTQSTNGRISGSRATTILDATVSRDEILVDADKEEAPDMKAYASGYRTVFEEVPCRFCKPSSGAIPSDLKGTYFRAGPAMFSAGSIVPPKTALVQPKNPPVADGVDPSRMVSHPFEGDGAVVGITFDDDADAAILRYRYVRTNALVNERRKGQKCYNAMESTREMGSDCAVGLGNDWHLPLYRHHFQPGLNKNRKNTSNTRAIYWGKRLLSMWEGGLPYKLDSLALSTEGRSQLGGAIKREEDPFCSKMVVDSKNDRAIFYGLDQDSRQSEVTIYEFGANFRLVDGGRQSVSLPGFAVFNDFCATENYAVFVQPPISTSGMQFMFSKEPGKATSLEREKPAIVHLIPRAGSVKRLRSIAIPVTDDIIDANIHFVNAYEVSDDVIIDAIRTECVPSGQLPPAWPWVDTIEKYRAGSSAKSLWRYTVDTKTGTVAKKCLSKSNCAFGVINPAVSTRKHRFIYTNVGFGDTGASPPQGIARYDTETRAMDRWMPLKHEFCGEPMFAPKTGSSDSSLSGDSKEEDGYILSVVLDGQREESDFIILDARRVGAGPLVRIPLGCMIPHGLFGCFAEDAVWSRESIERRARLADKMESRGNMWNEVKSDFSGLGLRLDDIDEYFPGLFG